MKLSIKALKEILQCAEEHDSDDELAIDYNDEYQSITIYLNEHAWKMFKKRAEGKEEEEVDTDEALAMMRHILEEGLAIWGCRNIKVETHNRGELEVAFEKNGKHFHFYFG